MNNIFIEHWELFTGVVSSVFAFFGGRKMKKADEKKATSEALETMQKTYDTFVEDFKNRYEEIKTELVELKSDNRELQKQFNNIQLAYAKEVEISQNWEKLHRELELKYNEIVKLYDKLKKDFEAYKRNNKSK